MSDTLSAEPYFRFCISRSITTATTESLDCFTESEFIVSSSVYKPGPTRTYKTTLQLVQVKVSNFVSKIEVEKLSSFLPTYSFPVGLRSQVIKQKFTLLSW